MCMVLPPIDAKSDPLMLAGKTIRWTGNPCSRSISWGTMAVERALKDAMLSCVQVFVTRAQTASEG
jgi:hypothetical protein